MSLWLYENTCYSVVFRQLITEELGLITGKQVNALAKKVVNHVCSHLGLHVNTSCVN